MLNGRKLGGILSELRTDGDRLDYMVMGLGLNVNVEWSTQVPRSRGIKRLPVAARSSAVDRSAVARGLETGAPPDIVSTATSLLAELGYPVDRLSLLAEIIYRCEMWYERLLAAEAGMQVAEPIDVAWAARLETLGRQVNIAVLSSAVRGIATGVTPEGALLVLREDGSVEVVWNGDVI
jgi:BirA family biotin operon repressor/biotin-[acetyl-CoA-carboxylase] ligase